MPARLRKPRRKPPPDEIQDAIPAGANHSVRTTGSGAVAQGAVETGTGGASGQSHPDPTDGSIPGTPARQLLEVQADRLDEMGWSCAIYGSLANLFGSGIDKFAYKLFVDHFLGQMAPAGPAERMLAGQLLLSHHAFGHLQVKGMTAGNPDAAKVYLAAAARLMGEFRQTALALKAHRTPPAARPTEMEPTNGAVAHDEDGSSTTPGWYSGVVSNRLRGLFRDEPVAHT